MSRGYLTRPQMASLIQLARPELAAEPAARLVVEASEVPLDLALKWARAQKAIADLAANCRQVDPAELPEHAERWLTGFIARLSEDYGAWLADPDASEQKLAAVVRLFGRIPGVRFCLIKGAGLATTVGDRMGARLVRDVDIIVDSAADFWRAYDVLCDYGFALAGEAPWLQVREIGGELVEVGAAAVEGTFEGQELELDFHWPTQCCGLYVGQLFVDYRAAVAVSDNVVSPGPADLLLAMVAHAQHHGYAIVKDLRDCAMMIERVPELDWEATVSRAVSSDLHWMLGWIAHCVNKWWGVALPSPLAEIAVRWGTRDRWVLARKLRALRHASRQPGNGFLYAWRHGRRLGGWRVGLRAAAASLFWLFESELLWRVDSERALALWFRIRDGNYALRRCLPRWQALALAPAPRQPWRERFPTRDAARTARNSAELWERLSAVGFTVRKPADGEAVIIGRGRVELLLAGRDLLLVSPNLLITGKREQEIDEALCALEQAIDRWKGE